MDNKMSSTNSIVTAVKKQLEVFAVAQWVYSFFLLGLTCTAFTVWICFTSAWPVVLLYSLWYIYDRDAPLKGGRRSDFIRRASVWKYFSNYFPLKLVKTCELDDSKNYLFACHPHGILSISHFANFATEGTGFSEIFPKIIPHLMVLPSGFKFPFFRDYFISSGACNCEKEGLEYVLNSEGGGHAACLIVGGPIEALHATPDNFELNLAEKKGFIKSAIRTGASLVPVYSFGENALYSQLTYSRMKNLQRWLTEVMNFAVPMPYGSFGFIPYRRPVSCVVGKPIEVEKKELPTQEEIDELHKVYVASLTELFEGHKQLYGISVDVHLTMQ